MRPGDRADKIGDRSDHRRPNFRRASSPADNSSVDGNEDLAPPSSLSRACADRFRGVPAIGRDMANSRRADSVDPDGAGAREKRHSGSGSDRGRPRKRRASMATSRKSASPQLSRITSSRSPFSPVAASSLCAVEHKTEYVAPRVMLRSCDWALFHRRSTASTQHNVSAPREIS